MAHENLDFLLYAWLSEADERRAELLFTRYFRAAFPQVCRFLHSLGAEAAAAQDISQQALIKLFAAIGTGRKNANGQLREALRDLRPLDFGALHGRLVQAWRDHVQRFADAAVRFRIPAEATDATEAQGTWKVARDEINGRTDPLQRQGMHLLRDVRERLGPAVETQIDAELPAQHATSSDTKEISPDAADGLDEQARSHITRLLQYVTGRDPTEVDTALGCPGAVGFITRTNTVCENLPVLAIPSNGLLYTIAKRQHLDNLKSRWSSHVELTIATEGEAVRGVLEGMDLEDGGAVEHEASVTYESADLDDESGVESRYRAFLEFLRAPLTRAEHALAAASSESKASAEQARVESLRRKYERLVEVLRALHESPQPSEEEIASRLDLSRNQVKYVIERVREEFSHFFPDLAQAAQGRRKRQGAEL